MRKRDWQEAKWQWWADCCRQWDNRTDYIRHNKSFFFFFYLQYCFFLCIYLLFFKSISCFAFSSCRGCFTIKPQITHSTLTASRLRILSLHIRKTNAANVFIWAGIRELKKKNSLKLLQTFLFFYFVPINLCLLLSIMSGNQEITPETNLK